MIIALATSTAQAPLSRDLTTPRYESTPPLTAIGNWLIAAETIPAQRRDPDRSAALVKGLPLVKLSLSMSISVG